MFLQEGVASHNENMQYVNLAVRACTQRQRSVCHSKLTQDPKDTRPVKRDSNRQVKSNNDPVKNSVGSPFGPYLIPVCQQEDSPGTRGVTPKDVEVQSSRKEDCTAAPRTESASAARLHQGIHESSPGLTHCTPCDYGDGNPEHPQLEDCWESRQTTITTNDLLDCLVHPDIMARVTELLLKRHRGSQIYDRG